MRVDNPPKGVVTMGIIVLHLYPFRIEPDQVLTFQEHFRYECLEINVCIHIFEEYILRKHEKQVPALFFCCAKQGENESHHEIGDEKADRCDDAYKRKYKKQH